MCVERWLHVSTIIYTYQIILNLYENINTTYNVLNTKQKSDFFLELYYK